MNILTLTDYEGYSELEVIQDIVQQYSDKTTDYINDRDNVKNMAKTARIINEYNVLIAYKDSCDYDASSWFLFKHKETGDLCEMLGGYCSYYGFEGQFDLEPTTKEYLLSDKFNLTSAYYAKDETYNKQVKEYFNGLD